MSNYSTKKIWSIIIDIIIAKRNLSLSSSLSSLSLPSLRPLTYGIFTILYPVYPYPLLPSDISSLSTDWFCVSKQEKRSFVSLGEDSNSLSVHSLLFYDSHCCDYFTPPQFNLPNGKGPQFYSPNQPPLQWWTILSLYALFLIFGKLMVMGRIISI